MRKWLAYRIGNAMLWAADRLSAGNARCRMLAERVFLWGEI